jgi:phosphatidylglycerophosphate synthase
MIDTILGRTPVVRDFQTRVARILGRVGLTADLLTFAGAGFGIASAIILALGYDGVGLLLLLASAGLDAIDGTVARECSTPTAWGGILDLCADRVVEIAVLIGIAWSRPQMFFAALVLAGTWYVNITVFLATGAAAQRDYKFIAYPPGMVERAEAIIFFVILVIFSVADRWLCWIYALLELATAVQRLLFARRMLSPVSPPG